MLLLSCGMTGASIYILLLFNASNRPEAAWGVIFGWLGVGFFGLCACVFLALLARPPTLLLNSAGFTLAGGLNLTPQKTAWRHVERFFVNHEGFLSPGTVGLRYRGLPGERILPVDWELPTREMVARLNAYRERALACAGDPDDLHVASESPASERPNVEVENLVVFGPERYVTSARKVFFMLLLGCALVAGSFFVTRAVGLFAILFLAVPLLRLLWLLIRPYKLMLDGEGFTLSGGTSLKPQKTAWRDVERFFIRGSVVPGPKSVAWACVAGRSPKKRAFMSHFLAPEGELADGELPDLWTSSAPELEQRLNAYRARALAAQDKLTK
ncbi:hypothetical protein IYX23_18345 [Methylocystis sp. L43]|uniref:hypothetical protein n=1 Tax=unclassified Methylocystis TaxID=2625913 RepID=UPI0018C20C01|nr:MULTISPECIES: hypothetical protein [unclassified Methylocystis]MBG0799631.1 hypothetical protein [Methylocystis sp. L43]MBG0807414.1 hypothetical protein [Methylocystis sp. H15]